MIVSDHKPEDEEQKRLTFAQAATGASGGAAADAGFTVQAAGSTVLGFSFTGGTIPAGCGTLTELALSGDATGLSGIVFSDASSSQIDVTYYDGGSASDGGDDGTCDDLDEDGKEDKVCFDIDMDQEIDQCRDIS